MSELSSELKKAVGPMKFDRRGEMQCRICGCTSRQPCEPSCSWADDAVRQDICSTCDEVADKVADWFEDAHKPKPAKLLAEAKFRFANRPIPYAVPE